MTWSEYTIARAVATQTLAKKCVVLVDNCGWTGHECDVLAVTTDLRIIDVEVKISRSDLKADARKDKWWQRHGWGHYDVDRNTGERVHVQPLRTARQHPPKVWKHYYCMPKEIWKPELLDCLPSPASGVLLVREPAYPGGIVTVTCERRATPARDAYRLKPEEVLDIARLANLRMWDAYGREDSAVSSQTTPQIMIHDGLL